MIFRLAPLLLLVGCSAAKADNPESAFRQCVLGQARALNSSDYPTYAQAKTFAENCIAELKRLPAAEQQQLARDYTCAVSGFAPPCPPVTD